MTDWTYDTLLMDKKSDNIDNTEEWEDSIDVDSVPKLKYPVTFMDEILEPLDVSEGVVEFLPIKSKRSIKTNIVNISKKGRNDKAKGIF
jgi:hypothetical protein